MLKSILEHCLFFLFCLVVFHKAKSWCGFRRYARKQTFFFFFRKQFVIVYFPNCPKYISMETCLFRVFQTCILKRLKMWQPQRYFHITISQLVLLWRKKMISSRMLYLMHLLVPTLQKALFLWWYVLFTWCKCGTFWLS